MSVVYRVMSIRYNKQGQTLMEVIFAMFILVTALVGVIVLIVTSINASRQARNKLIGTNLAREAIEHIRDIRDSNWIDPTGGIVWDEGLFDTDASPTTTAGLVFDLVNPVTLDFSVDAFSDTNAEVLLLNNFYTQGVGSGTSSSFYRLIYVNNICRDPATGNENIEDKDNIDACGVAAHASYANKVGIRVIAEIRWPSSSSSRNVKIEDRLYNWQQL